MREIIRGKLIDEGLLPAPVEHQELLREEDEERHRVLRGPLKREFPKS